MSNGRADIRRSDVFISWTGKDHAIKEQIYAYLSANGISCLESDESCSGDYRQWSREAVGACSIFLLILTEHTAASTYVPKEIEALKALPNWQNRVVPVCTDMALYQEQSFGLHASESAVILDGREPSEQHLAQILHKTRDLLTDHLYEHYCEQTKPNYIKLMPLGAAGMAADKQFAYADLYISRSVTELDAAGQEKEPIEDPTALLDGDEILFISGPAGSGKTQYINQIREAAAAIHTEIEQETEGEDKKETGAMLVLSLPCAKTAALLAKYSLLDCLFAEYSKICGNATLCSKEHFQRLLTIKHTVLIFDGMDEIATQASTSLFLQRVAEYYEYNRENCTLFFFSRNEKDAESIALGGKPVRRFRLNKLENEQTRLLGDHLFLLFGSAEKCDEFYLRVKDMNEEIRSNPLLLSQLAIVYQTSGQMPQTVVGIYDAISTITLRIDTSKQMDAVPAAYADMVGRQLGRLLKAFSRERYELLSCDKQIEAERVFAKILKTPYPDDNRERAAFLMEYLQNRAILTDGEFYHKMFLEYFTAVDYYEHCFNDYDELEDTALLRTLLSHYEDPYWSKVIQLFLIKADSRIDAGTAKQLYTEILSDENHIDEYTLLFDACRDMPRHARDAQLLLVTDILQKSINGVYPPYGPLFWYVPEYGLYERALAAAIALQADPCAVALVRDVCFIFGLYNTAADISAEIDAAALFEAAQRRGLCGLRAGLCELFYTGHTDMDIGYDVYPRCFNIEEARSFMENGYGISTNCDRPFQDELRLFRHDALPVLHNEHIGFGAAKYNRVVLEEELAYYSCAKLRGLALHGGYTRDIERIAFDCTHIEVLYIPESAIWINTDATQYMPLRRYVTVLHMANKTQRIIYFTHRLVLPPVERMPYLTGCTGLTDVTLPDTLTLIGVSCFRGCTGLRSLRLPDGIETIEMNAFKGCTELREINLPDSIQQIGFGAFEKCSSLVRITLPSALTAIEDGVFRDCSSLVEVVLPPTLQAIQRNAFTGCTALPSIALPPALQKIDSWAFSKCAGLRTLTLPSTLQKVDFAAFEDCTGLVEISLPAGQMFEHAFALFRDCTSLQKVSFAEGMTEVHSVFFEGCSSLTDVSLPSTVTVIGSGAFYRCISLTEIDLPSHLYRIEPMAFADCTSLSTITLPDELAMIGEKAFENCHALKEVHNLPRYISPAAIGLGDDVVITWRAEQEKRTVEIAPGTQEIVPNAYAKQADIATVLLPDGLTRIGEDAFSNCLSLAETTLPDTVETVADGAFDGCLSLNDVTLPAGLRVLGTGAFRDCKKLTEASLPDSITYTTGTQVFANCSSLRSVKLPTKLCKIGDNAFSCCTALQEVTMPQHLQEIESGAFEWCEKLTAIHLPNTLERMGWSVFYNCTSLQRITIPFGITELPMYLFSNCTSLSEVCLPWQLRVIGSDAFAHCSSLQAIDLPASLQVIEWSAFRHCTALLSINIPDGVKEINRSAFEGCSSLHTVKLPDKLKKIEQECFAGCTALQEITLPTQLTEIGEKAFTNCSALRSIRIPTTVRIIEDDAFAGCTALQRIDISHRFEGDIPRIFGTVDKKLLHFF